MALVEDGPVNDIAHVLLVPLGEEQHGLCVPLGCREEALAVRVLADALENRPDRPAHPLQPHRRLLGRLVEPLARARARPAEAVKVDDGARRPRHLAAAAGLLRAPAFLGGRRARRRRGLVAQVPRRLAHAGPPALREGAVPLVAAAGLALLLALLAVRAGASPFGVALSRGAAGGAFRARIFELNHFEARVPDAGCRRVGAAGWRNGRDFHILCRERALTASVGVTGSKNSGLAYLIAG